MHFSAELPPDAPAYQGTDIPALRRAYKTGKRVAVVGIFCNAALAVAKILAGVIGHSAALVTDGIHTLSDIVTSAFVYIGMQIAEKGPDSDHPYGHGKAESVAGKAVSVALVMVGVYMGGAAIRDVWQGEFMVPATLTLWVAALSVVIKEMLYQYTVWYARKLDSSSLHADAQHHRSDAISSLAAILGIALAIEGGPTWAWCDAAAAFLVALFIIHTGVAIFKEAAAELMDAMIDPEQLRQMETIAADVEEVLAVETIRARKSGLGILADLHIEVAPDMTVEAGHRVSHLVKAHIQKAMPTVADVIVHIEPHYTDGPRFKHNGTSTDAITPQSI
jgi:cation diffusion facilitator family transporter